MYSLFGKYMIVAPTGVLCCQIPLNSNFLQTNSLDNRLRTGLGTRQKIANDPYLPQVVNS